MLKVEFLILYIKEKKYFLEKWRINCYRIKDEIIIRCNNICTIIIPRIFLIYYPIKDRFFRLKHSP